MSTGPRNGPNRPGAGLVEGLRRGEGYERLYNAYASQLYRYCWTLVGDDANEAVYESMLSAVQLLDELDEHADLRPWLFSLARSACQRHGFVAESPYARLSDEPAERPMVEIALRLPPSHSELLELYLRHGLASSQIARIHGLDPDIISELCHAAVRRAADIYAECSPENDGEVEHRGRPDHTLVSEVLALMEPPAPPEGLRDRTVRGCADSAERAKASTVMAPLGTDGFPLQRDRSGFAREPRVGDAPDTGSGTERVTDTGAAANTSTTTAAATLLTSQDTSTDIAAAELAPGEEPEHADHPPKGGRRRRKRRGRRYNWPLSATSGLLTVGVALALWGAALLAAGDTNEPSRPEQPGSTNPPPAAEGTSEQHSPRSSTPGGEADPNTPGWESDTGNAPDRFGGNERSGAESGSSPDSDAPDASPNESPDAGEDGASGESSTTSPEEESGEETGDDSAEAPGADDDSTPARGPISRFFNELFAPDE